MHATATTALPRAAKINSALLQPNTTFVCMVGARKPSFSINVLVANGKYLKTSENASWAGDG
jgi:hypothetical protein